MTFSPEVTAAYANRVLDRCTSTNDLARQLGEQGAPHGTWVSAKVQERGRGRLGRQWESMEGNLFLSMVARIEEKSRWTWVPLTTAVAVVRAMIARYPRLEGEIRIKWPNDLWLWKAGGGAKLGGILCEAVGNQSGSFIVIGLGLNCAFAPEGLDQSVASLSEALAPETVTANDLRDSIIQSLQDTLKDLIASGPAQVTRDYERWAALRPGQEVEWTHPSSAAQEVGSAQPRQDASRGVVRGLGELGELCIYTASGQELKLFAEDVRIRPKAT